MPAEIVPGLCRLPGVKGVNCYLWQPADGAARVGVPLLFDCGLPWSGRNLTASLVALGVQPEGLQTIAVTHDDFDHVGRLAALHAVSGAPVVAHRIEAQRLASDVWRRLPGSPFSAAGIFVAVVNWWSRWLPRQGVQAALVVEDGTQLPGGWLAVHTPGHTPGHTAYFHPENGILIAGDALGLTSDRRLVAPMRAYCEDPAESIRSIRKLAALAPSVVCPGHGPALYDAGVTLRHFADRLPRDIRS